MGPMFKKIFVSVIGAVATAYVTKVVNEALERKPLKTRIREGKEKAVQIKADAAVKAADMKAAAQAKASQAKAAAQVKAADLKFAAQAKADAAKAKANRLIEERDQPTVTVKDQKIVLDDDFKSE